ncbi:hypothetical protein ACWEN3_30545, partial [Streptomyces sp. NPDC004561]
MPSTTSPPGLTYNTPRLPVLDEAGEPVPVDRLRSPGHWAAPPLPQSEEPGGVVGQHLHGPLQAQQPPPAQT